MPMIDVNLPEGLVPVGAHARLAGDLARALLRAEGRPDASPYAENTGVYLHVLLREAAEGGWGVSGSAFGREEFAALRAGAAGAAAATP